MMSIQAFAVNAALKKMAAQRGTGPKDYLAEREANAKSSTVKIKKNIRCEQITLAGVPAEKLSGQKANGKTVLYIHGGGFTSGSAAERRWLTQYLAEKFGYTVIAPDYRLSPEHKWPCHMEDCYAFYQALLKEDCDPKNLILMGESAGGTLCLSLTLRLRDEGLPLPCAIAVFSPWINLTGTLHSHTANTKTDYMLLDDLFKREQFEAVFGEIPPMEVLKSPQISPFYGDYTGLPPIFMSASDTEVLYDDSALLYKRLKEAGHKTILQVAHGLCHAWPTFTFLPETKRTLKEMENFFKEENVI